MKSEGTEPVQVALFQSHTLLEILRNFLAFPKDLEGQKFLHLAPIQRLSAKSVSDDRNLTQQKGANNGGGWDLTPRRRIEMVVEQDEIILVRPRRSAVRMWCN